MDIILASTAMGMAAWMTFSGTGPRATSAFSTISAIFTEPSCGSSAVSTPTIFTGLPLMPPAALISRAACWAPQSRYSPMLAIGPVSALRNGISHSFTATLGAQLASATSATASTSQNAFLIRPPWEVYFVSSVERKEHVPR